MLIWLYIGLFMIHIFQKVCCTAFLLILLISGFKEAYAQKSDNPPSSPELVAIAMFKTAGVKPDFKLWASKQPAFKIQPVTQVAPYLERETTRLEKVWDKYNLEDDILYVGVKVEVGLEVREKKDKQYEYLMRVALPPKSVLYFPVIYQDYNIALIPQNLNPMFTESIHKEQYDYMLQNFGGITGNAWLNVGLKPLKAYLDKPQMVDRVNAWAFFLNTASLNLFSETSGTQLWAQIADWYVSPKAKELNGLYNNRLKLKQEHSDQIDALTP